MTIELGSQKIGRIGRRAARGAPTLPIGEVDANIFACPACTRPLGTGTRRCPGCATRLIGGVKASRATVFVAAGGFTGIALSAGLMMIASTLAARPIEAVVVPAAPVVAPSNAPIPSAPPPAVDPGIPSSAVSALRQSTALNQRVLDDAGRLTIALSSGKPSSSVIAPILRSMASTATFGAGLAPTVANWDRAGAVSEDLAAFYAAVAETSEEGLSASFSSTRAYVTAGQRMLEIVAGLDALDAASRDLAASVDLELPPLTEPSS